jgi:hypothetical protein
MALPTKALRFSQLKPIPDSPAVKGTHKILPLFFIEHGVEVLGYFKELEPKKIKENYPELLAKMSVAASVVLRLFQGKNAAEERLVFDNNDKLIGTFSIEMKGFRPFNYANEPQPIPALQEQLIPSKKTLIAKNTIETLLGRWFLDDDDTHPHNLGFAGNNTVNIDFDMCWYWFTIYMKGERPLIGVPKKSIALSLDDYKHFPIIVTAKPFHWAAYDHPGQETLPFPSSVQGALVPRVLEKLYAAPLEFQQLAYDAEAQEQKLAAALKILLTYQPEMLRARLIEQFGTMSLNYTSLDATDIALRKKYEEEFPRLCNEQTNGQPFVDFIMGLYQQHYDNLYRVVVFYMGCENNCEGFPLGDGVPLPATHVALYNKPSLYRDIENWVNGQNATLHSHDAVAVKYNVAELEKRYHQIWRDAFSPRLKKIIEDLRHFIDKFFELTQNSFVESSISTPPIGIAKIVDLSSKSSMDESLTRSSDFLGTMPELPYIRMEPFISIDQDNGLRNALELLTRFNNQLSAIIPRYQDKQCNELTLEDNRQFFKAINDLIEEYEVPIATALFHTSTPAINFRLITTALLQLAREIHFPKHLITCDDEMKMSQAVIVSEVKVLSHKDKESLNYFNDTLFTWIKSQTPEKISDLINEIIDKSYTPYFSMLSMRKRTETVKLYLNESMKEKGDRRLAYILSSGTKDGGALNTLLIKKLTLNMLMTNDLPRIKAVVDKDFKTHLDVYVESAVIFAKKDPRFIHLYNQHDFFSKEQITSFYNLLFEWVKRLPRARFEELMSAALKEYDANIPTLRTFSSLFSSLVSPPRTTEVKKILALKLEQDKMLARIFEDGGEAPSSLNHILFHKVVTAFQDELKDNFSSRNEEKKIILAYDPIKHTNLYKELKAQATAVSNRVERKPAPTPSPMPSIL